VANSMKGMATPPCLLRETSHCNTNSAL
jgi:hypothetical protein